MFGIDWSELMIIAVVALVVIGPKDLPQTIYGVGKWVRKARLMAREFQGHIDDMMREAELDDLRQQALKVRDMNLQKIVEEQVDPKKDLAKAFELPPEMSGSAGYTGSPAPESPEMNSPSLNSMTSDSLMRGQTPPTPAADDKPAEGPVGAAPHPVTTDKPL